MQASKQEKQKYLVAEIIDKNYDPEDFQEYLFDLKGSSFNLDSWELSDLQKVVTQYQKSKLPKSEENISPSQSKQKVEHEEEPEKDSDDKAKITESTVSKSANLRKQESVQESELYLEFNYTTKQEIFSQVIDCTQIPPNQLLKKNVEIKIEKFVKREGGIFQQAYYTYIVSTPCLGKVVERRYNDFLWLKTTLEFYHPGLPVPPIAKKGQFRRSDDKHLNKRRMILEMFLNKVAQIPQLKADQIFENFLKFDDVVMFEKFKSDFKRTNNVPLSKVRNTRGKLNLVIDPKINNFLVKSQRNLFDMQPMTKRLYKEFKGAATQLEACSETLLSISKLCMEMDAKDKLFRKQAELKYCSSNIYTILMDSSKSFSQLLDRQAKIFRTQLYKTIKFESLNMINMLDTFDKLKACQQQYIEGKNSLIRRKQKLFEQGNMAKWGMASIPSKKPEKNEAFNLMLPKETEELSKLRVKYALRNFQIYEQVNRHYLKNNQYLSKYLLEYTKLQSQISSELMMVWVDAQTQAMAMEEGRSIVDVQM